MPMRALLLAAVAFAIVAAAPAEVAPMLTAADLDAARVLPPPPAPGSVQAQAELAELHAVEAVRTPADEADARADGEAKTGAIFAAAIGPGFDLARLPATTALLAAVRASEKEVVARGKDAFRRPRPYVVDPTLRSCKRNDEPLSSYPSGHTAAAFSMGETLAALIPDRAAPILARAARYGQSRIVCEQHFRSDVAAGQTLGALIAERPARQTGVPRAVRGSTPGADRRSAHALAEPRTRLPHVTLCGVSAVSR